MHLLYWNGKSCNHISFNPGSMKQQFQSIYRQLRADVDLCRQRDIPELERIECCFRTASVYWMNMLEELGRYHFTTEEEEIDFFRNIKLNMNFKMAVLFFKVLHKNICLLINLLKNSNFEPILNILAQIGASFFSKIFFTKIFLKSYIFIKPNTMVAQWNKNKCLFSK